jgi:5-methylcytosine-specific restriction endonuclease McrBC regulatory subunit McrC
MTQARPDITIWHGSTNRLLVIDTKYKEKVYDEDLRQIWIYCIVLHTSAGILVYPKHATLLGEKRPLRRYNVHALLKAIDLSKPTLAEFKEECNRFAGEVELIIKDITTI